jgi:photosystem II stability/assembly factor-like uncharacterized protein
MRWKKFKFIPVLLLIAFGLAPNAMGQWVSTGGPSKDFYVSEYVTKGTNVFAIADGYLYKSSDAGKTWVEIPSQQGVDAIAACDLGIAIDDPNGIYSSTNDGSTWERSNTEWEAVNGFCGSGRNIFYSDNHPGVSIWQSTDAGLTWNVPSSPLTGEQMWISSLAQSGKYLIASGAGFYLSTDDGTSWQTIIDNGSQFLGLVPIDTTIYTAEYIGQPGSFRLARTTNYGLDWEFPDSGLGTSSVNALASLDKKLFIATDSGMFIKPDYYGAALPVNFKNKYINSLSSFGSTLLAGTFEGNFRSIDSGISWTRSMIGMTKTSINALASIKGTLFAGTSIGDRYSPYEDYLYLRKHCGMYRSSDEGANWDFSDDGFPKHSIIDYLCTIGTHIFAALDTLSGGGLYRSTDQGAHWDSVFKEFTITGLTSVGNILLVSASARTHYEGGGSIYRSMDEGQSWQRVYNSDECPLSIATVGSQVFVSTPDSFFVSIDNGLNWKSLDAPYTGKNDWFPMTAFTGIGANIFASPRGEGIFFSSDYGVSWTPRNNGLAVSTYANCFVINSDFVFAGTNNGIYISSDNGLHWHSSDGGFKDSNILSLVFGDKYLFAGTANDGVYASLLSDFHIDNVNDASTDVLKLQLSPNPTTGIIAVHNAPPNILHITITNILGEFIGELTNSGGSDFTLDLSKFPSGTYVARFTGEGEVITRKIIKE